MTRFVKGARIEVSGRNLARDSFPTTCTVRLRFAERGRLDLVTLFFYTGGSTPPPEIESAALTSGTHSVPVQNYKGPKALSALIFQVSGLWVHAHPSRSDAGMGFHGVSIISVADLTCSKASVFLVRAQSFSRLES